MARAREGALAAAAVTGAGRAPREVERASRCLSEEKGGSGRSRMRVLFPFFLCDKASGQELEMYACN